MTSHYNFRLYHATTRSHSPPRTTVWTMFLCGQKSAYYTHPSSWKESLQQNLYDPEQVDSQSCMCKACEKDIKRHLITAGYIPRWRINTGINIDKCIVPGCSITSDSGLIIHTGLVSTQQVASLLGIPLPQLQKVY